MKQYLLLSLIALLLTFNLKGQEYVPFPTENCRWNVFYAGTCSEEEPPDTLLLRYTLHGDTTINEISYRKLCLESGDTASPKITPIGGIREADKKIYYCGLTIVGGSFSEEYLLYDFTKQVGDTIKHDAYSYWYSVVLEVGSVQVNGVSRKMYKVDNHWYSHRIDTIIEGIGSVKNGLLGHISDIPTCGTHYWEHICFCENGTPVYINPAYDACYPARFFSGIADEMVNEADVTVFPNPFNGSFRVENRSQSTMLNLLLTDLEGRVLLQRPLEGITNNVECSLDAGVYIVQITTRNGKRVSTQMLVKW